MNAHQTRRILVIEDDEVFLNMIKLRLELNGYEVIARSDALEGLSQARKFKPDLIILDLSLPGSNLQNEEDGRDTDKRFGHKICRMIKFDGHLKRIPVMIMTGSDSAEDISNAIRARADAFLMKTVSPDFLLSEVKRLVDINRTTIHAFETDGLSFETGGQ